MGGLWAMMGWASCELCGSMGHSPSECQFVCDPEPSHKPISAGKVDFDEAGRQVLEKLKNRNKEYAGSSPRAACKDSSAGTNIGSIQLPSDFPARGARLLERVGLFSRSPAATES